MARRIIGSKEQKLSTAMEDIVPNAPTGWTVPIIFQNLSFHNVEECHVIINKSSALDGTENRIYLRAGQGLDIDEKDIDIFSFVIVEDNIPYNFVAKC